jgi:hypothetical protein
MLYFDFNPHDIFTQQACLRIQPKKGVCLSESVCWRRRDEEKGYTWGSVCFQGEGVQSVNYIGVIYSG